MDLTELLDWMAVRGAQLSIDRVGFSRYLCLHSRHRGKLLRAQRATCTDEIRLAFNHRLTDCVREMVREIETYEKNEDACCQEAIAAAREYAETLPAGSCEARDPGANPDLVV